MIQKQNSKVTHGPNNGSVEQIWYLSTDQKAEALKGTAIKVYEKIKSLVLKNFSKKKKRKLILNSEEKVWTRTQNGVLF